MQENLEVSEVSEAEQRLLGLQAGINESLALTQTSSLGAVAEDFVQISVPGHSGNVYSGDSRSPEAPSPMMSFASLSRGVSRGGFSFLASKGKGLCLSDIGDRSKFCLKVNCPVVSNREAKKFDPMDEGSIVIDKGRDAAFALPALGGSVLPRSVYEDWLNEPKPWKPGRTSCSRLRNKIQTLLVAPNLRLCSRPVLTVHCLALAT